MSLRLRLVAGMLVVAAVGLLVAAVATFRLVQSTLVDNLDEQLLAARPEVLQALGAEVLADRFGNGRPRRGDPFSAVAPGTHVEWVSLDGEIVRSIASRVDGEFLSPPDYSTTFTPGDSSERRFFTTRGEDGGPSYRVLVNPLGGGLGTLLVSQPLTDVQDTLRRLIVIEGGVALAVLVLAGIMGLVVVRLGLRPLDRVVSTADAITAGDLEQRVPFESRRTEVGHLGRAFNAMVSSLRESMRQREESEQKLRAFVADASHELRTPLTSLKGYSDILERPDLSEEDRELAGKRLREGSDRMSRLVDDMLTLARLDEEPERANDRVDLCEVAEAAVDDFRAAAPDWPVTLDREPDCFVAGDADQLGRIVLNLLRNVQIHTPAGTSAGVNVSAAGNSVFLEVWDSGPGIAPEDRERVFERFFRIDRSRARERGGSGLGLSIVASIIEAHGGKITALERDGGGTMFRAELPVEPAG